MNDFQARQPKGIPIGGQFATAARGEANVNLSSGPSAAPATPELDHLFGNAERHDALLARGYVPPTFFAAVDDPRTTARRREWWDQHFLAGEHSAEGAGYPKMPDDYTPGKTHGRALSGHRRTHRMSYSDDGVTLRMPSVTAIKRYAQETGSTFDVPVSARDEASGRTITGWVRVTNNGAGVWAAEGLGFSGNANAKISEAVASRLESRRPARGPRETGDLIERFKMRQAAQGAKAQGVRSSWISAVGYNAKAGVMFTATSRGNTYGHFVDADTFEAIRSSDSPGAVFNSLVKGKVPGASVSKCPKCERMYAEVRGHSCGVDHKAPAPGPKPVNLAQRQAAEDAAMNANRRRGRGVGPDHIAARLGNDQEAPRVARRRPPTS